MKCCFLKSEEQYGRRSLTTSWKILASLALSSLPTKFRFIMMLFLNTALLITLLSVETDDTFFMIPFFCFNNILVIQMIIYFISIIYIVYCIKYYIQLNMQRYTFFFKYKFFYRFFSQNLTNTQLQPR